MDTFQSYFFQTPLFPNITDNDTLARVGVNNSNPQTDFDVNGTIRSTNYTGSNVYVATATAGTVDTNTLLADYVSACNVVANIGVFGQVQASSVYGSNLCAYDDIQLFGVSLSNTCPIEHNTILNQFAGENFTYSGYIDNSWINYPPTLAKTLEDIATLASDGLAIADLLSKLNNFMSAVPTVDPVTAAMATALAEALSGLGDGSGTSSNPSGSNKITVAWQNVINRPLANYGTKIGVNGDILLGGNVNMVSAASTFQPDHWGNTTFVSGGSATGTTVIDSNFNMYTNVVNSSNILTNYVTSMTCNASLQFQDNASLAQISVLNKNNSNNNPSAWTSGIMKMTDSNFQILHQVGFGAYTEIFRANADGVFAQSIVSRSNDASLYFPQNGTAQLSTLDKSANPNDPSTWKTGMIVVTPSNNSFVSQTGFGTYTSNLTIDTSGSLYVRSNIAMNNVAIIRSVGTTDYTLGFPVAHEGVLTLDPTAMRYVLRNSNVSLSNSGSNVVDNILFSINSNGLFLLTKSAIYGQMESVVYANPVNPLSNLTFSNFSRVEYSLQNGLKWGVGLSNDGYTNLDIITVSRLGEISIKDSTTSLMEMITTSNASLVRGKSEIKKDGSWWFNNKVVLDSNGTLTRGTFSVNSNGAVSASNITLGSNTILTDGQLLCLSNFAVSNSVMNMSFDGSGVSFCNLHADRNGGLSVGTTYLSPSGGIEMNQQVIVSQYGSMYPQSLKIGNLVIQSDGSIWNGNRELFDAQGNLNASCIAWNEGGVIATPNYAPPQNVYQGSPLDY